MKAFILRFITYMVFGCLLLITVYNTPYFFAAIPDNPLSGEDTTGDTETSGEIGVDFRISTMGPNGNPSIRAGNPAVAYNSVNKEYLVVWSGADTVIGDHEIWGQLYSDGKRVFLPAAMRLP